jgi:hypothetical protein
LDEWNSIAASFAQAPEITLFGWNALAALEPIDPGDGDAWKKKPTSFIWDEVVKSYKPSKGESAAPTGAA